MSKLNWKHVVVLITLLVIATIVFLYIHTPQNECTFIGWKRTAGIEVGAMIEKLEVVKAKLDVTDAQIRELDKLLADYGLKYEAICRDYKDQRITKEEYSCKRENMDKALDNIRSLSLALDALAQVRDAPAQKEIALKALQTFKDFASSEYSTGCNVTMTVRPRQLTFENHYPERSIEITNSGNKDSLVYTIEELPEAFTPRPPSGEIKRGNTVAVSILRTPYSVQAGKVSFYVRNNWGQRLGVEIIILEDNARIYDSWSTSVMTFAKANNRPLNLEDTVWVIKNQSRGISDDSARYLLAAGVLAKIDKFGEANRALKLSGVSDSRIHSYVLSTKASPEAKQKGDGQTRELERARSDRSTKPDRPDKFVKPDRPY